MCLFEWLHPSKQQPHACLCAEALACMRIICAGACEMAKDLSTSTLLNNKYNKLQQVAKEAFAIWTTMVSTCMHQYACLLSGPGKVVVLICAASLAWLIQRMPSSPAMLSRLSLLACHMPCHAMWPRSGARPC